MCRDCGASRSSDLSFWNTTGIPRTSASESCAFPQRLSSRGFGTSRLGNLPNRLMNLLCLTEFHGQIALRNDADAAAFTVHDGYAPDLTRLHPFFANPNVFFGLACHK